MNQYAADQIALVATLTQERKRSRRWKLLTGLVVVAAVAHQLSASVSLPQPLKRGVAAVQKAAVQAAPAATPVQPPAAQSELTPTQRVVPSAEDRRREAAAAARAWRRYDAEVLRMQQRQNPPPVPQRSVPQPAPQPERQPQRGVSLGSLLMTAAQAARVAEQIERGRFSPARELNRAARRMEREERRRRREERRLQRRW